MRQAQVVLNQDTERRHLKPVFMIGLPGVKHTGSLGISEANKKNIIFLRSTKQRFKQLRID